MLNTPKLKDSLKIEDAKFVSFSKKGKYLFFSKNDAVFYMLKDDILKGNKEMHPFEVYNPVYQKLLAKENGFYTNIKYKPIG